MIRSNWVQYFLRSSFNLQVDELQSPIMSNKQAKKPDWNKKFQKFPVFWIYKWISHYYISLLLLLLRICINIPTHIWLHSAFRAWKLLALMKTDSLFSCLNVMFFFCLKWMKLEEKYLYLETLIKWYFHTVNNDEAIFNISQVSISLHYLIHKPVDLCKYLFVSTLQNKFSPFMKKEYHDSLRFVSSV